MANRIGLDFESQTLSGISGLTVVNTGGTFDFVQNYQPAIGDPDPTWALRATGTATLGQMGLILGPFSSCAMNTLYFQCAMTDSAFMYVSWEYSSKLFTSTSGVASYHYDQAAPYVRVYSGDTLGLDDALDHDQWIDHRITIGKGGNTTFLHDYSDDPGHIMPNSIGWSNGGGGNVTTVSGNPVIGHPSLASGSVYLAFTFVLGASDTVLLDEIYWTDQGTIMRPPTDLVATTISSSQIDLAWDDNED